MIVKIDDHPLSFNSLYNKTWYILERVPDNVKKDFELLTEAVLKDPKSFIEYNSHLAGQIENEYRVEYPDSFFDFLSTVLVKHEKQIKDNYARDITHYNLKDYVLGMQQKADDWSSKMGWVNLQKKYEYNPPHVHAGELSFIYWSKVPYTTKGETIAAPSPQANAVGGAKSTLNGATYFVFNRDAWYLEHPDKKLQPGDSYGANWVALPVTKKWEGIFCLFPSYQIHGVNPFYSSDECRVSYSANVTFRKPSSII